MLQLLPDPFAVVNIHARTDVTGKRPVIIHQWYRGLIEPSTNAVVPTKPILQTVSASRVPGARPAVQIRLEVLGVNTGKPRITQLRNAGVIDPRLVEIRAAAVLIVHPDQGGNRIGELSESLLTFADQLFGFAFACDVLDHPDVSDRPLIFMDRRRQHPNPVDGLIGARETILAIELAPMVCEVTSH